MDTRVKIKRRFNFSCSNSRDVPLKMSEYVCKLKARNSFLYDDVHQSNRINAGIHVKSFSAITQRTVNFGLKSRLISHRSKQTK